jgi:prevent-host-death family protein
MTVTVEEASKQLAHLIDKAESGEEIVISRDGAPAIRLTPVAAPEDTHLSARLSPRIPGLGKGQIQAAPEFDAPMPDDWLDEFYNGEVFPCKG